MKRTIISLATLTLGVTLSALMGAPAVALEGTARDVSTDDGVMPISETTETSEVTDDTATTSDEIVVTDETTVTDLENIEEEGTSGESEVVCTEEADENCAAETEVTEEEPAEDCTLDEDGNCVEAEPEMWPMVLSLGAIGVTVIITIILAVAGRNKK